MGDPKIRGLHRPRASGSARAISTREVTIRPTRCTGELEMISPRVRIGTELSPKGAAATTTRTTQRSSGGGQVRPRRSASAPPPARTAPVPGCRDQRRQRRGLGRREQQHDRKRCDADDAERAAQNLRRRGPAAAGRAAPAKTVTGTASTPTGRTRVIGARVRATTCRAPPRPVWLAPRSQAGCRREGDRDDLLPPSRPDRAGLKRAQTDAGAPARCPGGTSTGTAGAGPVQECRSSAPAGACEQAEWQTSLGPGRPAGAGLAFAHGESRSSG